MHSDIQRHLAPTVADGSGAARSNPVPGEFLVAKMGARLGARLIDGILLSFAWILFNLLTPLQMKGSDPLIVSGVMVIVSAVYEACSIARFGRTLGKAALDLRVVTNRDRIGKPAVIEAWARALMSTLSTIFFPAALTDVSFSLFDEDNRMLHDRASRSLVVTRTKANSKPPQKAPKPQPEARPRRHKVPGRALGTVVNLVLVIATVGEMAAIASTPEQRLDFPKPADIQKPTADKTDFGSVPLKRCTDDQDLAIRMAEFGSKMVPAEDDAADIVPGLVRGLGYRELEEADVDAGAAPTGRFANFVGSWRRKRDGISIQLVEWRFEDPARAADWMVAEVTAQCRNYDEIYVGHDNRSVHMLFAVESGSRQEVVWIRDERAFLLTLRLPKGIGTPDLAWAIVASQAEVTKPWVSGLIRRPCGGCDSGPR